MTSKIPSSGNNGPKKAMTPALPIVSITHPGGRGGFMTSPIRPSPLREGAVAAVVEAKELEADTKSSDIENTDTTTKATAMTPPNEAKAVGPLVVDSSRPVSILPRSVSAGSIERMGHSETTRAREWDIRSAGSFMTNAVEDPFVATPDRPKSSVSSVSVTPTPVGRVQSVQSSTTPVQDFSPREDRLQQPITPANAQGRFGPEACVFVANLSNARSADQLEFSVEQALSSYGKCYVKINLDKNKMPYAFVQFEKQDDARLCIQHARGLVIDGRPIRTEHAKAHRSVYLTRITGGAIDDGEARDVLGRFGAIEETCATTIADQELAGLPEGIWVKYRFFMDCKDAITSCRHNSHYRLIVHNINESPYRPRGVYTTVFPSPSRGPARVSYQTSGASIFVGNLPSDLRDEDVPELFQHCGKIVDCKVMRKAMGVDPYQINTFAFLTFGSAYEAERAMAEQIMCSGRMLRIEAKRDNNNSSNNSSGRRYSRAYPSPKYNFSQQQDGYPNLYNPNVSMGVSQNQSGRVLAYRPIGPPQYGNASPMAAYNQYSTPPYGSPMGPRGGNEMSSSPGYYGNASPAPYYGQFMGPYGTMHSIEERGEADNAENGEDDGEEAGGEASGEDAGAYGK